MRVLSQEVDELTANDDVLAQSGGCQHSFHGYESGRAEETPGVQRRQDTQPTSFARLSRDTPMRSRLRNFAKAADHLEGVNHELWRGDHSARTRATVSTVLPCSAVTRGAEAVDVTLA